MNVDIRNGNILRVNQRNREFLFLNLGLNTFRIRQIDFMVYRIVVYFCVIILTTISISELVFLFTQNSLSVLISVLVGGIFIACFQKVYKITQGIYGATLITISYIVGCILISLGAIPLSWGSSAILYTLALSMFGIWQKWNYSNFLIIFLIGFEMYMVSSFCDGEEQFSIFSIMTGFFILTGLAFASAISIVATLVIFCFVEPSYFSKWNIAGMLYLAGICLSIACLVFMPIQFYLLQLEIYSSIQYSLILNSIMIGYSYCLKDQITLFFCDTNEHDVTKQDQFAICRQISQKSLDKLKFNLISDNYCLPIKPEQKLQNSIEVGDCLVCFEEKACVLFMPCGHIALCLICHDKLLRTGEINCILCKQAMNYIFIVDSSFNKEETSQKVQQGFEITIDQQIQSSSLSSQNNIQKCHLKALQGFKLIRR